MAGSRCRRYMRYFRCTGCGIMRAAQKRRKTKIGHIKHMYCPICKGVTEHIQVE